MEKKKKKTGFWLGMCVSVLGLFRFFFCVCVFYVTNGLGSCFGLQARTCVKVIGDLNLSGIFFFYYYIAFLHWGPSFKFSSLLPCFSYFLLGLCSQLFIHHLPTTTPTLFLMMIANVLRAAACS